MRARLISLVAASALALAAAGCGSSDSANGGDAGTAPANDVSNPAATVPTAGSEDTETSPSKALGGAGPTGGDSGDTSPGSSPGY
jgi:hypothetical protein